MGFQRSLLKFTFPEGSEFVGLEVRARRLSIDGLVELIELSATDGEMSGPERYQTMADRLAGGIVEWNLDDPVTAEPVPVSPENLRSQDPFLVVSLVKAWIRAASAVPAPLPQPSTDGDRSLEASIPMEPSSPSPTSSPEPDTSSDSSDGSPATP